MEHEKFLTRWYEAANLLKDEGENSTREFKTPKITNRLPAVIVYYGQPLSVVGDK